MKSGWSDTRSALRRAWRLLNDVSVAQWLLTLGLGGAIGTAVRVLTALPWPAYTGAGSAVAIVTGVVLLRQEVRPRVLAQGVAGSSLEVGEESERLAKLRRDLRDIKRVTKEEMDGFQADSGIEAGGRIRAGGDIEAPGDVRAGVKQVDGLLGEPWLAADRALLTEFRALLPSSTSVMQFLRDYDFGASFRWDVVGPLDEFIRSWDDAEHQFHDDQVDAERASLHRLASEFVTRLAFESHPEAGGWQGVVPIERRDDFRIVNSDDARRVDEINAMSTAVFEQHQRLIGVARRRLAV